MKRLRHQVRARRDLSAIWSYTSARWDAAQADLYLFEIDDRLQQLANGEISGTGHDRRYRRLQVGSHVAFYRESGREVTIVRILHPKQDAERHLPRRT